MVGRTVISSVLLLVLIGDARAQFFDFFGFPTLAPPRSTKVIGLERTTRRTKTETIRVIDNGDSHITWKNTTYTFTYEGIDKDNNRQTPKEKKRKLTIPSIPTLAPIFNFYTTTLRPVRKANKNSSPRNNNNSRLNYEGTRISEDNDNNKRLQLTEYNSDKTDNFNAWYEKPQNNIADDNNYYTTAKPYNNNYYTTAKPYNNNYYTTTKPYNNNYYTTTKSYNSNYYTTKNPFFNRPGVKPAVVDNRPPITNRPPTKRPFGPQTSRPATPRPVTNNPTTVRPYIVNPIPTDAGALVFPHEYEEPTILRGPDEDNMSASEKRRYIEIAERMCDKYKALHTKQLQAIPLLPSPDPVQVNVSKCTPTTIPLVVGGKVVSVNEFPHMALLGWEKVDGGGYSWKCGGSLISDQYVLTAAHCSYQERDNTVVTGPPRVVQLGSSYLDDPGALVVRVSAVVRHPKYKFPRSYYDIALLKLVQPVTFSEVIKPACLGVPPSVSEPIIATGWGKTELGGDQSLELRSVSLPVWDMDRCSEALGTSRKMPSGPSSESQLCAGDVRGGKDTCQGDSGGPAQIQDGCVWRVAAVTSLGRSCGAPNTPGLYALVHRAFISAQVFGDASNKNNQNRRSDNSQTTEQNYNSNRRTTTTEPYYNKQNNNNYNYNSQSNRRTENNDRRTTTTTESYNYNNQRRDFNSDGNDQQSDSNNDYSNQNSNSNHRINTNDNGYNSQNDYRHREQNDYYGNPSTNNRQQNQYGYEGEQQDNYNSQSRSNRRTEQTTELSYNQDYFGNSRQQNLRRNGYDDGRIWFT